MPDERIYRWNGLIQHKVPSWISSILRQCDWEMPMGTADTVVYMTQTQGYPKVYCKGNQPQLWFLSPNSPCWQHRLDTSRPKWWQMTICSNRKQRYSKTFGVRNILNSCLRKPNLQNTLARDCHLERDGWQVNWFICGLHIEVARMCLLCIREDMCCIQYVRHSILIHQQQLMVALKEKSLRYPWINLLKLWLSYFQTF